VGVSLLNGVLVGEVARLVGNLAHFFLLGVWLTQTGAVPPDPHWQGRGLRPRPLPASPCSASADRALLAINTKETAARGVVRISVLRICVQASTGVDLRSPAAAAARRRRPVPAAC
jgi:hypothetical protein